MITRKLKHTFKKFKFLFLASFVLLSLGVGIIFSITRDKLATSLHTGSVLSQVIAETPKQHLQKNVTRIIQKEQKYTVSLAKTNNTNNPVTFSVGKGSISFATFGNTALGQTNTTTIRQENGKTIYDNIYNGVSLIYTNYPDRLLEEYEVKVKRPITEIIQKIDTTNVAPHAQPDGSIIFTNTLNGQFAFALPRPVMYEAVNTTHRDYDLHYEMTTVNGQTYLIKVIDPKGQAWLQSRANYPVMIDATVSLTMFGYESYPVLNNTWQVRLDTVGQGDLTLGFGPGTSNYDLKLQSLTCGNTPVTIPDSGTVNNFSCSQAAIATYQLYNTNPHSITVTYSNLVTMIQSPSPQAIGKPVIVSASVNPPVVKVGDTITVTAQTAADAGIQTVTADMGGIETINLSLQSGDIKNGTWIGTWVVRNTATKTYPVTVTAIDTQHNITQNNVAFFDPYTCLGGGDHAGANWDPATDCASGIFAGNHTNIGTFSLANAETATVQTFDDNITGGFATVSATTVTINSGGTLTANAAGWHGGPAQTIGFGPGAGGGNNGGGAGGSYGGVGSNPTAGGDTAVAGNAYGNALVPPSIGSGGGGGSGDTGGAGAGYIRLTASGTMTVSGTISSNGGNGVCTGNCNGSAGGSGGTIYLTAGTFTGSGIITANGGNGSGGNVGQNGEGSGGRVSINYSVANSSSLTTMTAIPGTLGNTSGSTNGTVVIVDTGNNDLYINTSQTWNANPNIDGSTFSYRNVTVQNSSTWTLNGYNTNNTNGVGMTFNITTFTLNTGSTISGNGAGYPGGAPLTSGSGPGAGGGNNGGGAGGSYGGSGSNPTAGGDTAVTGNINGAAVSPTSLGSGGGGGSSAAPGQTGGAGGGAVKINASGTLTVNGTITENGANGMCSGNCNGSGAGSGGAIFLIAGTFTGTGTLTANGGNGVGGNVGNNGVGGGGRIAINYSSANTSSLASVAVNAGTGGAGGGSVGTYVVVNTGTNDLYINASQTWYANSSIDGSTFTYHAITVQSNSTWTLNGYSTNSTNGVGMVFTVTNFTVSTGSKVNGDGQGYAGGVYSSGNGGGSGGGTGSPAGNVGGGGGGYGGTGGAATGGYAGGGVYYNNSGTLTAPVDLGSGGGSGGGGGNGGAGGGAIGIIASGTVTVSGTISANGGNATVTNGYGGGGSGGSIHITSGTLAGAGTISANGGNYANSFGGGGSGGRVSVSYSSANNYTGTITATGGTGQNNGASGTNVLINSGTNDLYVSASQTWNAKSTLEGQTFTYHSVTVQTNSTLTLNGTSTNNTNGVGQTFNVTNFTIASGSTITGTGGGYAGGVYSSGNGSGSGGGAGSGAGNVGGGGGGYGGAGGGGTGGFAGGSAYGSATYPVDLGSGGGSGGGGGNGGAGGDAVKIVASGTITVSGTLSMAGGNAPVTNGYGGGGAGGSIWLATATLTGAGTISAGGGNYANSFGGGGGGGRIAIYYSTANNWSGNTLNAATATPGGTGSTGGSVGTVTLQSKSLPTLSSLAQYQSDCTTVISSGGAMSAGNGCLGATITDANGTTTATLDFEVETNSTPFTNTATSTTTGINMTGTPNTQTKTITTTVGNSYHWQVRVTDQFGFTSGWIANGGNPDFIAQVVAPTSLITTYVSDTQFNLSWSYSGATPTGFAVERSINGAAFSQIGTTPNGTTTTYSDTSGLASNEQIQYRVRTFVTNGGTSYSLYATGVVNYTSPSAASSVSLAQNNVGTIVVSWTNNSPYAQNFTVQRKIGSGSYTTVTTSVAGAATSYTDTNVQQNLSYTYQIQATITTPTSLTSSFVQSGNSLTPSVGFGKGVYLTSTGTLVVENDLKGSIDVFNNVQNDSSNKVGQNIAYDSTHPTNGPVFPTSTTINNLTVKEGASLADGKSDVIYAATNNGVFAINQNATTPASGTMKVYTKDYISELMVGDTRGMWPLDNGFGSGLSDASSHSQTLTNNGSTTFTANGVRGNSMSLNGTTQYLSITSNSNLSVTGSITFGAWFKTTSTSTAQTILAKNGSYTLSLTNSGTLQTSIIGSTTGTRTGATTLDTGWHHAVAVYNSTTLSLDIYLDGRLDDGALSGTIPSSITASGNAFNIGANNGATLFSGNLDETFISATAANAGEIYSMYQAGWKSLQNHTANRIVSITGANSYQQLLGSGTAGATVNTVKDVKVDDTNQFLYVGTNDSSTSTGGVTVIGTASDSVADVYSTINTAKIDDGSNAFSANNVVALGISGTPNPAFNGQTDVANNGGIVVILGTNNTATRVWMESQKYSLNQVLSAATGPNANSAQLNVNTLLSVGNTLAQQASTSGELQYLPAFQVNARGSVVQNYLGTDTTATAVSFADSIITTGTTVNIAANALSTGHALSVNTTSTLLSSSLVNFSSTASTSGNSVLTLSNTGATTGTDYSLYATATGLSTTNVAGYFSASNATNNYGLLVANGFTGLGTTSPLDELDVRGVSGTTAVASISAQTSYAALLVDNAGTGDIFTASTSGMTQLRITNSGSIIPGITNNSNLGSSSLEFNNIYGQNIYSNGTLLSIGGYLQRNSGVLSPVNITDDFTLGGVSTSSATFGFINIASGTPTASISATSNATYLTQTGILSTTNMVPLVLGSATTGSVQLSPKGASGIFVTSANNVGIGTTDPTNGAIVSMNGGSIGVNQTADTGTFLNVTTTGSRRLAINTNSNGSYTMYDGVGNAWHSEITGYNGNVGIGVTTPSNPLAISFAGTAPVIELTNTTANNYTQLAYLATSRSFYTGVGNGSETAFGVANKYYVFDNNASAMRMVIDTTGNLGVGTTSPLATFDVRGQSGTTPIASLSAKTSFAGLVVDNSGFGDLFTASTSGLSRFVITQGGRVGVGTTTPAFRFDLQDTQTATATALLTNLDSGASGGVLALKTSAATAGTGNNFVTFLDGKGEIIGKVTGNGSGGVTYATTGIDFAEYYKKDVTAESLNPGTVVCQGGSGVTTCVNNQHIIGVVSNLAGFAGGSEHVGDANYVLVGLIGQLPVRIASGAAIMSGDVVTTNPQGEAVKAVTAGQTIGTALQNSSDTANGTILVAINISWYDPNIFANNALLSASQSASVESNLANVPLLTADIATVSGTLNVLGRTTLSDVGITGTLSDGVISIHGLQGQIDTLAGDLMIQSEGLGGVNFLNGLVTIDTSGNVRTKGVLSAATIQADKVNVTASGNAAAVGEGFIPVGSTSAIINTNAVTAKSVIFVTAKTKTNQPLSVTHQINGQSFTVEIEQALQTILYFNWWVVN